MPGLLDNRGPYSGYDPKKDKYLLGQPKQTDFTGAGNFYKGLASGALGLPADILQMMSDAAAAGYTPGRKSLQIPLTSDKIGGLLGADVHQDAFKSGLLGSPDPGDLARMGGKGLLAMTLFHGGPHKFDKFDLAKIGTGEGAQAYGHGLYFAQNADVAKAYVPRDLDMEDKFMGQYKLAEKAQDYDKMEVYESAMMHETPAELRERFKGRGLDKHIDTIEQYYKQVKGGHLYEVDIPDDVTAKMLDWDAPLSEQPESVRNVIDSIRPQLEDMLGDAGLAEDVDAFNGRELYQMIKNAGEQDLLPVLPIEYERALRSDERASMFLNQSGISGIRYYDAGSRGGKEGTRNIVLFDPDTITEVKRDGSLVYENKLGLKK